MSIQSEIDRMTAAKTAIAAAIANKGVSVPDGTLLDGFAALIDSIEAGGSVEPFTKVLTGTVTFATSTKEWELPEGTDNLLAVYMIWAPSSKYWSDEAVYKLAYLSADSLITGLYDYASSIFSGLNYGIAESYALTDKVSISGGKLVISSTTTQQKVSGMLIDTYWYALIYGSK